ncbi:MAG: phosphate signaling complex protein PhoU [Methanomassiliicoccaceae archaeon]|jgi:phosphate transport system protein|nr:phosphate signaling complex protein PhoU [Methanomassiliicoccaceae archaeon]
MRLSRDIKSMTASVTEMGELAAEMLEKSVAALVNSDMALAEEVKKKYDHIAFLEALIEDEALRILILYQPMASDMRLTATALKTITYLERIGKYSKNIAKAAIYLKDRPTTFRMEEVYAMCDVAVEMVRGVVTAFESKDISSLENYGKLDDKLDHYRVTVIDGNIAHMRVDTAAIEAYTYYISIAKYLERVGDNACKIAEKIIYMVSGKRIEIDRPLRGL